MRILAGVYKGRTIRSPRGRGTVRPMTGLARKSLFDILGGRLEAGVVADLYCGTGTLGLESLSRGARLCYFAERDRGALAALRRNIEDLGLADRSVVWAGDVTARLAGWLAQAGPSLDLAFVDPPYADARNWRWPAVAESIFAPLAARLTPDGLAVLRLPGNVQAPRRLGPLANVRQKQYGDMTLVFLRASAEGE